MSFAAQYIGQPWVAGESDCWSFARRVWADHFGISVSVVEIDAYSLLSCVKACATHAERESWVPVSDYTDGDGVLMGRSVKRPSHVGVVVGGGILHSLEGLGVMYHDPVTLGNMGWHILGYYRHRSRL